MKSGWWTEARSIEEKKWTQTCGMQKQQLVGALGLLCKKVDKITSLDTKIDNEALALALQSQVSFTTAEWDELKVHNTVICTSYISQVQESIPSNLPSQRNQQGQWEGVNQRLLDHWYEISGQLER